MSERLRVSIIKTDFNSREKVLKGIICIERMSGQRHSLEIQHRKFTCDPNSTRHSFVGGKKDLCDDRLSEELSERLSVFWAGCVGTGDVFWRIPKEPRSEVQPNEVVVNKTQLADAMNQRMIHYLRYNYDAEGGIGSIPGIIKYTIKEFISECAFRDKDGKCAYYDIACSQETHSLDPEPCNFKSLYEVYKLFHPILTNCNHAAEGALGVPLLCEAEVGKHKNKSLEVGVFTSIKALYHFFEQYNVIASDIKRLERVTIK